MAREPIPDPIDNQPPACIFISTVDDEISTVRKRFTVVLRKLRLPPRRYWEELRDHTEYGP